MRIVVAILLLLVAGLLGVVQLIAVIDPVGTKMADDGDPFGNRFVPWYQHAIFILVIIACVVIASRLLRRKQAGDRRMAHERLNLSPDESDLFGQWVGA